MKYNSEVTPSKLAPLLVSRSSVAIVESNEVTWNNTNVTDVGGEVGTNFVDMIDFSEVEEMHGGDNGTE
ncbi:unnamed protein product, partial [Prunus brigantina]